MKLNKENVGTVGLTAVWALAVALSFVSIPESRYEGTYETSYSSAEKDCISRV